MWSGAGPAPAALSLGSSDLQEKPTYSLLAPVTCPHSYNKNIRPWGLGGPPPRPRRGPWAGGGGARADWLWEERSLQLPDLALFLFCFEKLLVVYLRNRKKKWSLNAREIFSLRLLTGDLRLKRRRVLASGAGPEWPVPGGRRDRLRPGALTLPGWASWSASTDATHSVGAQGSPWGRAVHCGHMCPELLRAP